MLLPPPPSAIFESPGRLVLHELAHVLAHHAHADLLSSTFAAFGSDRFCTVAFQLQPIFLNSAPAGAAGLGKLSWLRLSRSDAAAGNGVADVLQHQAA
jgi:hypothetical protein